MCSCFVLINTYDSFEVEIRSTLTEFTSETQIRLQTLKASVFVCIEFTLLAIKYSFNHWKQMQLERVDFWKRDNHVLKKYNWIRVVEWMLEVHDTHTGECSKSKTFRKHIAANRKKSYSTWYSQVVPHPSTNHANTSLTSEIERDPVWSGVYGHNRRWSYICVFVNDVLVLAVW